MELSDYIGSEELVLFGDHDGKVYQMEKGVSFNGSNIISVYSTPYLDFGETEQRIVRTTFTMAVYAYLLPEKYDNQPTTIKTLTNKKVVWGTETDLTGGGGVPFSKQSLYNDKWIN